jgi:hypothetical protein
MDAVRCSLVIALVACANCKVALPAIDEPPVDAVVVHDASVGDATLSDGPLPCGPCAPRPAQCEDGTRVRHAPAGCSAGECQYETHREPCDHGCLDGRCLQCVAPADDFATLDSSMWRSWAGDDIVLAVIDGALRAERGAKLTESWGRGAGVALAPRLDFSGSGVSATWVVELHDGAAWTRVYSLLLDRDAGRSLAFDYGVDGAGTAPSVVFRLSFTSPFEHHWSTSATLGSFGQRLRFVLSNPAPRAVLFEVHDENGTLLRTANRTFTPEEWNGFDWVEAQWYSAGWPATGPISTGGAPNTVNASLHKFSATCSIDDRAPRIELGGPAPDTSYSGDEEITIVGKDAESGIRCVRVAWDDWPVGDGACGATTQKTRHPGTGERTLYVRAWDWAGNPTEQQARYLHAP